MKNQILVIPDIHGRDFWKIPCKQWEGPIIFLGDYHDPYYSQVWIDTSIQNLEQLVQFYKENKDRVIFLLGNHDGNYLIKKGFADRIDYKNYNKVQELLKQLNIKLTYRIDNFLFSHSGVLPKWLELNNITLEDLDTMSFNHPSLKYISPLRGGDYFIGGVLWGDIREYDTKDHIPNIFQIFGHTQMGIAIIKEDYACIDCRKCFILDLNSKKLSEYGK